MVHDLLVLGDCNPDLLITGDDLAFEFGQREKLVAGMLLTIGGSASITACGAARLGLHTAFVGVVGDDEFGRFMLAELTARGVDVSGCPVDPSAPTGVTVAAVRDGDRAMLTLPGTIATLAADQVPAPLLAGARHLHIGSYYLLDRLHAGLPGLVAAARAAGATVSVDPQEDTSGAWDGGLPALLADVDVLFVNEQEDAAIDSRRCPLVVVKRGPDGAVARPLGGEQVAVAGFAVESVDATGAGDSFDAGFLAGRLTGLNLEASLRLACACGALSTRELGGTTAQPTLDEARALR
jgi:sugar/nucleoside kinase (ribokinase family)